MRRKPHQGEKYAANPETSGWIKDGFTEWRYKATGQPIPEPMVSEVPNPDKIKISYVRKSVYLKYPKPHEFVYFDVKHRHTKGTETIGRITEYTTEDRLTSMIYRYYHPGHAQPFTISGQVKFTGGKEGSGVSRMPYLDIPDEFVEAYDLHVDDEISATVTCMDLTYTFSYHLSQKGLYVTDGGDTETRRLILPLTQIKRLVVVEDPTTVKEDGTAPPIFKFVTKKTYDEHTRKIAKGKPLEYPIYYKTTKSKKNPKRKMVFSRAVPCRRFIDEYVAVTVEIIPEDTTPNDWPNAHPGRFDLVRDTLKKFVVIDSLDEDAEE